MITPSNSSRRRFLAPEVVQSSAMDCGPATLKCLLEGFGIPISYGRLREACQTEVDGTSIDTLEEVAGRLGLDAEQILIPADHLFLPRFRALPALAVTVQPSGMTHFVVLWSRVAGRIQVITALEISPNRNGPTGWLPGCCASLAGSIDPTVSTPGKTSSRLDTIIKRKNVAARGKNLFPISLLPATLSAKPRSNSTPHSIKFCMPRGMRSRRRVPK